VVDILSPSCIGGERSTNEIKEINREIQSRSQDITPDASIESATFAARQKCLVNVICGFLFGGCQSGFLCRRASKMKEDPAVD
jgi:hypothetical protein